MARLLFTFVSGVSVLLCAATIVLWSRAHRSPVVYERLTFDPNGAVYAQTAFYNGRRMIAFRYLRESFVDPAKVADLNARNQTRDFSGKLHRTEADVQLAPISILERALIVRTDQKPQFGPQNHARRFLVGIADWLLVIVLALLPAFWMIATARRLRRRHRVGACRICGYSLTGNISGVCPECGKPSRG